MGILFYDVPKLKLSKSRERIVYGMLFIPTLYLSLIYMLDLGWPNLNDLVHFFFSKPAHQIVDAIKVTK
jgi:hypothetical protein